MHCLIAFHPWCTDVQRVKLMNQLLVGIRVLKMYAWEVSTAAALLVRVRVCTGLAGAEFPLQAAAACRVCNRCCPLTILCTPLPPPLSTLQAAQEAAVLTVRKDELGQLRKAIPLRVGMQVRQAVGPSPGRVSQRVLLSCRPSNTGLARCCLPR